MGQRVAAGRAGLDSVRPVGSGLDELE